MRMRGVREKGRKREDEDEDERRERKCDRGRE